MLNKKYDHKLVSGGKYKTWKEKGYFNVDVKSSKPSFTVILPPPNITGKLHLGHAWDGTIQDIIIRYKKLKGFNTLWVPGMDHAGISMQRKVEMRLRKQGIDTASLSRDEFLKHAFEWKKEHEEIIREQWASLGLALDYSKERFTMEKQMYNAVTTAFVKMYEKGQIYQGTKVINWDPVQQTAISNMEVVHKDVISKMYYFKYRVKNSDVVLEVATTRPETMFGDVCVMVNPDDTRYKEIVGKVAINPANGKELPILEDEYVDMEFGTGAMKVTPAHDFNDYELGKKHNLKMPICMNLDGTLNELANDLDGIDRFLARKKLVKKIKNDGNLIKIEEHENNIGHSERSDAVVEPLLSKQWFVDMSKISKDILKYQKSEVGKVKFIPKRFEKTFNNWLENVHDWCISRQLVWGHEIPAWVNNKTQEIYVGVNPPKDLENWTKETSLLDTWFSSGIWPISTLGWASNDTNLLKRFYPTDLLVTGYDILFFWVSRMMFQGKELQGQKPFKSVMIHGLVRAADGKKMSKSLGNGIDPMDVIDKYGVDAMRYFLTTNSSPGLDLRYDPVKVSSSWNFINKIWNSARYVQMVIGKQTKAEINAKISELDKWILAMLDKRIKAITKAMDAYELGIASKEIYNFIYDEFSSVYIELSKVDVETSSSTQSTLLYVLMAILKLLHPYMPFVTEHIYQEFHSDKSIMLANYPQVLDIEKSNDIENINNVILAIRQLRADQNIKNTIQITIDLAFDKEIKLVVDKYLFKLTNTKVSSLDKASTDKIPFKGGAFYIKLSDYINKDNVKKQINAKKDKLEKEKEKLNQKLSNQNFVNNAPSNVVDKYRLEQQNLDNQIDVLNQELSKIK